MSMLIQGFERPFDRARRPALISSERKARLERIALRALAVLTMGSVLTGLIALRTVAYVWRLHA
jgi:hypothetical protein